MVFLCGLINILITVTKIRKMIILAIPESLQHAIGGGIGLFVAYVDAERRPDQVHSRRSEGRRQGRCRCGYPGSGRLQR